MTYNEERLGLVCENDRMHVMDCFGEAVNVPWYLPEFYYQEIDA